MTAEIIPLKKTERRAFNHNLFQHLKNACEDFSIDLEERIRLAKTIAPLLSDKGSNQRHLAIIAGFNPTEDKVVAVIMLGFPQNREVLPFLSRILATEADALKLAAIIAIGQMKDGHNDQPLMDILQDAYQKEASLLIKSRLKQAFRSL
jgi:HEAT repeat protein